MGDNRQCHVKSNSDRQLNTPTPTSALLLCLIATAYPPPEHPFELEQRPLRLFSGQSG